MFRLIRIPKYRWLFLNNQPIDFIENNQATACTKFSFFSFYSLLSLGTFWEDPYSWVILIQGLAFFMRLRPPLIIDGRQTLKVVMQTLKANIQGHAYLHH